MSIIELPGWLKQHLYTDKNFRDLSDSEIRDLKERLIKFNQADPEVSIVIPAWNEENNIYRTLSSLAANYTNLKVELVVVNNNSTDNTQKVLDQLGVKNYFQPEQGISHARQMGLLAAKGKYHLCADSDTYYPPKWIDSMVAPMKADKSIVGVYGRYSFIPPQNGSRPGLWAYEKVTGILIRLRKFKREHINFLGFNIGFVTKTGIETGGFVVLQTRKFENSGVNFVDEAEDGRMAVNLKTRGKLKLITHPGARVFTSSRRLVSEGGIFSSFIRRINIHTKRIGEYIISPEYKE